jgi:hypothetical protein
LYIVAGLIIAAVVLGFAPQVLAGGTARVVTFVGSLFGIAMLMVGIGVALTGQRMGILWSTRNTYSLSRLQITLWTLLVFSALAAACACRAYGLFTEAGGPGTLATAMGIHIPNALLAAMGISVASAAASPAILSMKSQGAAPSQTDMQTAAKRFGGDVFAVGRVMVRPDDCPPLVKDLFRSDDAAAAGTVDVGKVQQFIVTLLLLSVYFAMLLQMFWSGQAPDLADPKAKGVTALPPLSDGFVWLMGVSHAGYLAYKAAPASAAAPGGAPGARTEGTTAADVSTLPRPQPPRL